jgi:DNA ligase (NAD+)
MTQSISEFLDTASKAYYAGSPVITDNQFDYLADMIGYNRLGAAPERGLIAKHTYKMYSLQKYYAGEGKVPLADYQKQKVTTPKLDGAAISILYVNGFLTQVLKRGDGEEGEVITDKFIICPNKLLPISIECLDTIQVTGEIVAPKSIPNARNYASGALGLLDIQEFASRDLYFVAYDCSGKDFDYYTQKLEFLHNLGFRTVEDSEFCDNFPQDGAVIRINLQKDYDELGFTSKHPRGAYAIKTRSSGIGTTLRDVIWQTGKSGKVTPVAIFDSICIDGANVSRATLNNPGFIKALDLDIGDTVFIERAGGIIPCVVRSEKI